MVCPQTKGKISKDPSPFVGVAGAADLPLTVGNRQTRRCCLLVVALKKALLIVCTFITARINLLICRWKLRASFPIFIKEDFPIHCVFLKHSSPVKLPPNWIGARQLFQHFRFKFLKPLLMTSFLVYRYNIRHSFSQVVKPSNKITESFSVQIDPTFSQTMSNYRELQALPKECCKRRTTFQLKPASWKKRNTRRNGRGLPLLFSSI